MKKLILTTAVIGLTVVSCTKDRTCTCTDSTPGATPQTTTLVGVTKGQAKSNCISTTVTTGTVTYSQDCKLD